MNKIKLGGYIEDNADTFGAGTLTRDQAESVIGKTVSGNSRLEWWFKRYRRLGGGFLKEKP